MEGAMGHLDSGRKPPHQREENEMDNRGPTNRRREMFLALRNTHPELGARTVYDLADYISRRSTLHILLALDSGMVRHKPEPLQPGGNRDRWIAEREDLVELYARKLGFALLEAHLVGSWDTDAALRKAGYVGEYEPVPARRVRIYEEEFHSAIRAFRSAGLDDGSADSQTCSIDDRAGIARDRGEGKR